MGQASSLPTGMSLVSRTESAPLGANYNERLTWLDHDELHQLGATWIRGLVEMHHLDDVPPDEISPNLAALLDASDAGFKTILSLKWDYSDLDFPTSFNGSDPAGEAELKRLHRLLPTVMDKIDIVVVGNEPFIECKEQDESLNVFYEKMADEVIEYRNSHETNTRLYMGALNRLDLPKNRTPGVKRMLDFIKSTRALDGVDLHIHIGTIEKHKAMMNYALERIRADQTFIITEFSLIWHWKRHFKDVVSSYYRDKHDLPDNTTVVELINLAKKDPIPNSQWKDFLTHEPWYNSRRNFMTNAMKLYRSTNRLVVATYGFCPMRVRDELFAPSDTPWLLNSVIAPFTVQLKPDGSKYENYPWAEEFRNLQSSIPSPSLGRSLEVNMAGLFMLSGTLVTYFSALYTIGR